jgi:hypothetical protein
VDVAWDVETFPGGPHIVLNGTVQQVYAQLIEINPDFSISLSDLFDYDDDDAAVVVDDVDEDAPTTLTASMTPTSPAISPASTALTT